MKKIISSMCALALLAGCVEQEEQPVVRMSTATVTRRSDYAPAPPIVAARVKRHSEPVENTQTQQAMAMRRAAMRRQEAALAFEREAYRSGPAQPSGRVSDATPPPRPIIMPPPMQPPPEAGGPDAADMGGPMPPMQPPGQQPGQPPMPPGPPLSSTGPASGPPPIAEQPSVDPSQMPVASPVPGKPGFVVSPFSPQSGYVDVSGLAPGSMAHDPYTGQTFRVP
jgi:hypothetical protein